MQEVVTEMTQIMTEINEEIVKTTKVSRQRTRKLTLKLDKLNKRYRKLSINPQ